MIPFPGPVTLRGPLPAGWVWRRPRDAPGLPWHLAGALASHTLCGTLIVRGVWRATAAGGPASLVCGRCLYVAEGGTLPSEERPAHG